MLIAVSHEEYALIARALAVAAKAETDAGMLRLGAALDARAALGDEAWNVLTGANHALRSYEYGNASTELAAGIADACDKVMNRIGAALQPAAL